jgi:hypothetical protein
MRAARCYGCWFSNSRNEGMEYSKATQLVCVWQSVSTIHQRYTSSTGSSAACSQRTSCKHMLHSQPPLRSSNNVLKPTACMYMCLLCILKPQKLTLKR